MKEASYHRMENNAGRQQQYDSMHSDNSTQLATQQFSFCFWIVLYFIPLIFICCVFMFFVPWSSHRILENATKEQSKKIKGKKLSSTIHDVNDHPMHLQIKTYTFWLTQKRRKIKEPTTIRVNEKNPKKIDRSIAAEMQATIKKKEIRQKIDMIK